MIQVLYSQQWDFWQGAARMKQPECIQNTCGLRIEQATQTKIQVRRVYFQVGVLIL
jgi:hypothetical protein